MNDVFLSEDGLVVSRDEAVFRVFFAYRSFGLQNLMTSKGFLAPLRGQEPAWVVGLICDIASQGLLRNSPLSNYR